ncbi:MAG TPA: hypothetical protein VN673_01100 [Clostridia bacterium]|nr:hypothetical protein [Clostridia bacterium]
MKRSTAVLGTLVGLLVVAILCYRWDSGTNHGYSWGYWGQFNTVSNALAAIPGLKIVKSGCNADVIMEEFGFDVTTGEGHQVHVWFSETDPVRKLSGGALSKALQHKIKKEASNKPAARAEINSGRGNRGDTS